jgi:hypothetical protein
MRSSTSADGERARADVGDAALRWELGEERRVVAGDDAVGGAGELDHAGLCGDVVLFERRIERGAGAMRAQILVEIKIVGGEDVGRIAFDENVL